MMKNKIVRLKKRGTAKEKCRQKKRRRNDDENDGWRRCLPVSHLEKPWLWE